MVVSDQGEICGAVSGGCVEGAVVEEADRVMGNGEASLTTYGISDEAAWDVGLQCGGEISVYVEPYDRSTDAGEARAAVTTAFDQAEVAGARAALVTGVTGRAAGRKLLIDESGVVGGTLGDDELDAEAFSRARDAMWSERPELLELSGAKAFVDVTAPPPRLVIFGAVDYAAPLCSVARLLHWWPIVVDPRTRFADPARFPHAASVISGWPEEAFQELGGIDAATAVVVLTHDPKLDDAALRAAIESDALYIGAMGSRTAQEARRERLVDAGVAERDLERIAAPVGLDLGAVTPAETALSVMSEIVAVRRGRPGGRLCQRRSGPIHVNPRPGAGVVS
jgi:xanthine dehydrogenase accessory factor